jgi:hypothetical protein
MTFFCVLCWRPIRRRWWHVIVPPLPVCTGSAAGSCHAALDRLAARARST